MTDDDIAHQEALCRRYNLAPKRVKRLIKAKETGSVYADQLRLALAHKYKDPMAFTNAVIAATTTLLAFSRLYSGPEEAEMVDAVIEQSAAVAAHVREAEE